MNHYWTIEQWSALDLRVRAARGQPLEVTCRSARKVLRAFSSSFFLVTRFLPPAKRTRVELIYAAVRYPDEIVDTFPIPISARLSMLDQWEQSYQQALTLPDVSSRMREGVPWILAGFAEVVREHAIPHEHYLSFLTAMRRDTNPAPYRDLKDLIANYIYGSAVVVGYFLAHVYGTAAGVPAHEAYASAANLGVALQLTNFCRDVAEDRSRGRLYIPEDLIEYNGLENAIALLAEQAESRYERAAKTVGVFASDTPPAIGACIDVYRRLNRRILRAGGETNIRHSVPVDEKLSALPSGKYWRVPLAYLGVL